MLKPAILIGLPVWLLATMAHADGPTMPYGVVVLQSLDKVTARIKPINVPLEQEVAFGTLRIKAHACLETPPTEAPESAAFLEIRVVDPGSEPVTAYSGWMFASSPSLAALEHPVYDVWVKDCAEPLAPEPGPPSSDGAPPSAATQNE